MVDLNIEELVAQSVRNNVETYLQNTDLSAVIADTLQKQINNVVLNLTGKIYNELTSKRDLNNEITQLIQGILSEQLLDIGSKKVIEILHEPEMNRTIETGVKNEVNRIAVNYEFPTNSIPFSSIRMDNHEFNASWINNGIHQNFTSAGIKDSASKIQLEITDDGIITTNNITAENLLIDDNAFLKNLTVDGDIILNGNILESSSLTKYVEDIADKTSIKNIENSNAQAINLHGRDIIDGDKHVLGNNSLGPHIINSNLRKVGNLNELVVSGQAIIGETLTVNMGRVGINTEETPGVLSIWDQESELSILKYAQKNMFVGSTRQNDITLGSYNQNQIVLKTENIIELNGKIRWNGLLLDIVDRIPEHNGEPNEIAILRDGSAIYSCRGQNIWGKVL